MSERRPWYDFAALLIGLSGIFNAFEGVSALVRKEYFDESTLIYQDLRVWAWLWIVVGIVQIVTASALVGGGGRKMAIAICAGATVVAFASVPAAPIWSLVIMVANVLVISHLARQEGPDRHVTAFPEPIAPPPTGRGQMP